MPRNANLIPTLVTDKNGKLTTVYRKPQVSPVATSVPAPPVAAKKDTNEVRRAVTERIIELRDVQSGGPFDHAAYIADEVQKYSERTLRNVELALLGNDYELAEAVAEQIGLAQTEFTVNTSIHFYWRSESDDYWKTVAEVSALLHYPFINQYDDLTVDETIQQQCLALMKFTRLIDKLPYSPHLDYIDDQNYDARVINDESLVALIVNRPEDVERIAEIVIEYGTSNGPTINGIMAGELPAVAEGYL